MRRIFLVAAAAVLLMVSAQAQFKPTGGSFGMEVQFRPLGINLIENTSTSPFLVANGINLYGISARFFCIDQLELRTDLYFGFNSAKEKTKNALLGPEEQVRTNSTTLFGLNLGANYHFKGTERISPYVGGIIGFGIGNGVEKYTNHGYVADNSSKQKGGAMLVDFAAVTGFNWYIVNGLYLGAEMGLGLEFAKDLKGKTETKIGGTTTTTSIDPVNSTFGLGFFANPTIRLGWKF
jgi:outer membrane protein W